jgi:hypothetical protein
MCQRELVVARLLQILAVAVLALLVVQATLVSVVPVTSDGCAERCADDCAEGAGHAENDGCSGEASGRGCPPDCQFCACCGLSIRALAPVAASLLDAPSFEQRISFGTSGLRSSPEPRAILHVPKLIFA